MNKSIIKDYMKFEEIATVTKKRSGLSVNIFLNDSGIKKHQKKIYFQADKEDRPNTKNIIPMSIESHPKLLVDKEIVLLSSGDIDHIRDFVRNNENLLIQLANATINIKDFLEKMI